MDKIYDTAIIGGGIAGYSAALSAKSLKLDCLWLGEKAFGDKTGAAEYVRNYPAFSGDGAEFVAALERQRAEEGIVLTERRADDVYPTGEGFTVLSGGEEFFSRTVILATGVGRGARVRGEREFLGRGVSYCAVCDGALYRGKKIAAVLSDGDAAEAEYLASFADEALLFCEKPVSVRAANIKVIAQKPIAIEGVRRVERIVTQSESYAVSGVFFLGKALPPDVLLSGLEVRDGKVAVARDMRTNVKGAFAAGDMTGTPYQFVKAAGEGCVAAYGVKEYLKNGGKRA